MRRLTHLRGRLGGELGTFEAYRPDDATLAAVAVPVQVLVSEQSAPFYPEIARWLAQRLGVEVSETPERTPTTTSVSGR